MITATLTSKRHIAAVQAQYINSRDGANAAECLQRAVERLADEWAERLRVDEISVFEFVERFGAAKVGQITAAAATDATVASILAILRGRQTVRLGSPDAINGVGYLVSAGYLTQGEADAVLAYDVPAVPA